MIDRNRSRRRLLHILAVSLTLVVAGFLVFAGSAAADGADGTDSPETAADARRQIVTVEGHELSLPFVPAVWSGDLLFLSGALGNQPGTTDLADGGVTGQTVQMVANLDAVLQAAGLDRSRLVSADVYLNDLRDIRRFLPVLIQALGGRVPAISIVEADIALPDAEVEMSLVAAAPGVEIERIDPEGWRAGGGGTAAVRAGDVLFVGSMTAFDPTTMQITDPDVGAQTRTTMANVRTVVEAAGFAMTDVVRCRVFLPDARDFRAMNTAYAEAWQDMAPPARSTVRARLVNRAAKVAVQCIAAGGDADGDGEGVRQVVMPVGATPSSSPLSSAIAAGPRLYLSGKVGRDADGWAVGIEAQTERVLEQLLANLDAAGLSPEDVVNATVYLADIRHYDAMNAVYARVLGTTVPARATVGSQLMGPDALVEIDMIANHP